MTVASQPRWMATLIELLDRQETLYGRLQRLSDQQTHLVEEGDAEQLLALLAQRQTLIDQLLELNGRIEPFRRQWPELWAGLGDAAQRELRGRIDAVQRMLDQILERDEQNRQTLLAHRRNLAGQMQQTQRGAAAHRIYGSSNPRSQGPRYTDRQG